MPQLPGDIDLKLVENIDDLFEMKRWFGERRPILGVDTETSGLDPWAPDAKLRTIQIGDHRTGWTIPWEGWGGAAVELLRKWDGLYALHNASFDAKWLSVHAKWNMPWDRTHDTLIMAQIIRPGERNDLKYLSTKFVDPRADAGQKELKEAMKANNWDWGNIPTNYPAYWVYASLDPVLTVHLWDNFRADKLYPASFDLEMASRRICTTMEMKGLKIDPEYCEQQFNRLTSYVGDAKLWAKEEWGVSIGSGAQLAKFFAEKLNAEFSVFSKTTGNPSVDKNQLAIFAASDDPAIRQVAQFVTEVRHAEKMSSSYFKNFINMNNNSILNPTIQTLQARTGRMSITNPAVQTLPSGESLIRNAFLPYGEDESLISCDYSNLEMRILAHYSNDPNLQNAFNDMDANGGDFFSNLGKTIYSDPNFSKDDKRRKLIKTFSYAKIFGSGVAKMAKSAGVPVEEMVDLSQKVDDAFPGIETFMRETEQFVLDKEKTEGIGYVVTDLGNKLPVEEGFAYRGTNYKIQSKGAQTLKRALVNLDAAGLTDYLELPIHDEIISSVPDDIINDVMPIIEECMSDPWEDFTVNLPAEPEVLGKRWGEGAKYV